MKQLYSKGFVLTFSQFPENTVVLERNGLDEGKHERPSNFASKRLQLFCVV